MSRILYLYCSVLCFFFFFANYLLPKLSFHLPTSASIPFHREISPKEEPLEMSVYHQSIIPSKHKPQIVLNNSKMGNLIQHSMCIQISPIFPPPNKNSNAWKCSVSDILAGCHILIISGMGAGHCFQDRVIDFQQAFDFARIPFPGFTAQ